MACKHLVALWRYHGQVSETNVTSMSKWFWGVGMLRHIFCQETLNPFWSYILCCIIVTECISQCSVITLQVQSPASPFVDTALLLTDSSIWFNKFLRYFSGSFRDTTSLRQRNAWVSWKCLPRVDLFDIHQTRKTHLHINVCNTRGEKRKAVWQWQHFFILGIKLERRPKWCIKWSYLNIFGLLLWWLHYRGYWLVPLFWTLDWNTRAEAYGWLCVL